MVARPAIWIEDIELSLGIIQEYGQCEIARTACVDRPRGQSARTVSADRPRGPSARALRADHPRDTFESQRIASANIDTAKLKASLGGIRFTQFRQIGQMRERRIALY